MQVKIYFTFNYTPDNKKTLFVNTFFRKKAERQLKPALRKRLNDNKDLKRIFVDFERFKKKIRRIFKTTNKKQTTKKSV